MLHQKRCRILPGWVVILGASLASGCLGFVHPVSAPGPEHRQPSAGIPQPCRNRVHIFILHGIDPLDLANLDGLTEYIQSLGYIKTHFGQPYHAFFFEKEILRIHKEEPTARFVLIGFSYGAGLARDLAERLAEANIPIDLLVYIDGVQFFKAPLSQPSNVLRVVNILALFRDPDEHKIDSAANLKYDDVWHFGAASHPRTLKMLAHELAVVARRVPITDAELPPMPRDWAPPIPGPSILPPPLPGPSVLPAPRSIPIGLPAQQSASAPRPAQTPTAKKPNEPDGWDFLQPDGNAVGVPGKAPFVEASTVELTPTRQR